MYEAYVDGKCLRIDVLNRMVISWDEASRKKSGHES